MPQVKPLSAAALVGAICATTLSWAAEPQLRAAAGASHALSSPQRAEYGWGATIGVIGELRLVRALSVQVDLEALTLSRGHAPPPQFAPNAAGSAFLALAGLRAYPMGADPGDAGEGLWISASGGLARTGSVSRPAAGADVGYDVWMGRWSIGPFISYRQVVQPDSALRPDDARIGTIGVQGAWAPSRKPVVVDDDWDRDGIVNNKDACPRDPEDFDGFQDADGCPDLDNDQDRVPDKVDRCPDEPEDRDGFEDEDGCPEVDNDKDGLLDKKDACPNQAEDKDGFEDTDGCPDLDNDKDEIPDVVDKCPDEPETFNGYADEDGCPDEISVRVVGEHIYLDEKIFFEWNRAEIRKESYPLVQRIATLLVNHPEYIQVRIEGHTDEMGSAAYNQHLSETRANAVREFIIKHGVAADRLVAVGFGETRPLIRGNTEKAASVNRRVELLITRRRTLAPILDPNSSIDSPPDSGALVVPLHQAEADNSPPPRTPSKGGRP